MLPPSWLPFRLSFWGDVDWPPLVASSAEPTGSILASLRLALTFSFDLYGSVGFLVALSIVSDGLWAFILFLTLQQGKNYNSIAHHLAMHQRTPTVRRSFEFHKCFFFLGKQHTKAFLFRGLSMGFSLYLVTKLIFSRKKEFLSGYICHQAPAWIWQYDLLSSPARYDRSTEDEHNNYGYDSGPLQQDGHG